jgi:hypothetical protein
MGFRFRKSVKLLPGVRLNLSKSGISTTLGVRGASVNLSRRGRRYTVGLPGTGLSYSETSARQARRARGGPGLPEGAPAKRRGTAWLVATVLLVLLLVALF